MKIENRLLYTIILGLLLTMFSCSSDDTISDWEYDYITILSADYLKPSSPVNLTHSTKDGINGNVELRFIAKAQRNVTSDVKVVYELDTDGIPMDMVELSAQSLFIPSGKSTSDTITLSISDWTELEDVKEAVDFNLKLKVVDIDSECTKVKLGTYYQEINLLISKPEERVPEEVKLTNPKDWNFTFMEGVENPNSNTVAGTGWSDIATNGIPFWVTVDFTEIKSLTGIETVHWGSGYAPTKIELFLSTNGTDWESFLVENTWGRTQTIKFDDIVDTRFIKYQMKDVPSRVNLMNFYVFAME